MAWRGPVAEAPTTAVARAVDVALVVERAMVVAVGGAPIEVRPDYLSN